MSLTKTRERHNFDGLSVSFVQSLEMDLIETYSIHGWHNFSLTTHPLPTTIAKLLHCRPNNVCLKLDYFIYLIILYHFNMMILKINF
jgi:hypothetical protein